MDTARESSMEALQSARQERSALLGRFFLLTYVAVLVNLWSCLGQADLGSLPGSVWLGVVYLTYGAIYLLPVFVPLALLNCLCARAAVGRVLPRPAFLLFGLAWIGTTAVQLLLHSDAVLCQMYGFHLNGFVWNLLTTEGGIESLGAGSSTMNSFALIGLGFLVLQGLLLLAAGASGWLRRIHGRWLARPARLALVIGVPLLTLGQSLTFCVSEQTGYRPVMNNSDVFPFYQAFHWRGLGEFLGNSATRDQNLASAASRETHSLNYPLKPLEQIANPPRPNIVWLVSESLRADMLDPEVMPETTAFAQESTRMVNHRSGSDGTRMAMFSMFYGLPGAYWFSFLRERRGPVLMDQVVDAGYQIELYTSARFTYPEFTSTLFARVPASHMHERVKGIPGWENDRRHVSSMVKFLDDRDQQKPFMLFMFFESPHSPYHFPDDAVIRQPYLEDFDYVNMDPERDMELVRNRYINSCHHLDSQLGRVFRALRERGLLESSIVIVTGDHGEEFMETGHWGHNSAFTDSQIRVPLLIHVPGRPAAVVDRLTSHLDLPATVLPLLGVSSDPASYSLGHDLFGPDRRSDVLLADWDGVGVIDESAKIVMPRRQGDFTAPKVTRGNDDPVDEDEAELLLKEHRPRLLQLLDELSRFRR